MWKSLCDRYLQCIHGHNIFIMCLPVQVDWRTYKKTITLAFFNAVVTSSIFQLMIYPLSVRRVSASLPLPSLSKMLCDLLVCAFVVGVLFYYNHRCVGFFLDLSASWELKILGHYR